jgi:hypothetical protein
MSRGELTWRERTSELEMIASVWTCNVLEETTRSVLADPCISIDLVQEGGSSRVVLSGPGTEPCKELLASGYRCTAIRLRPGVVLRGFSAKNFINESLTLPTDADARFWLEGSRLQFPGYDTAEQLISQLQALGYVHYENSNEEDPRSQGMSSRSYARLTKKTTGLSPYKLHQLQRIHQAIRLLKQGAPAATVAVELDFVDQAHLTRAVKQFSGYTPKELRDLPQNP